MLSKSATMERCPVPGRDLRGPVRLRECNIPHPDRRRRPDPLITQHHDLHQLGGRGRTHQLLRADTPTSMNGRERARPILTGNLRWSTDAEFRSDLENRHVGALAGEPMQIVRVVGRDQATPEPDCRSDGERVDGEFAAGTGIGQ